MWAIIKAFVLLQNARVRELLFHRKYEHGMGQCFWRWTRIYQNGELYLTRFHFIQTRWFAIMVHIIHRADDVPYLHDHPASFLSIVLRGGYYEDYIDPKTQELRREGRTLFNFIPYHKFHRIWFAIKPTVTLCFFGPVRQRWGVLTDEGKVFWDDFQAQGHVDSRSQ